MSNRSLLHTLRNHVFSRTGADTSVLGDSAFEVAVARRMSSLRCPTLDEYSEIYFSSDSEQQHLLDESTVPETWFFRESESYPLVLQRLQLIALERSTPIQILSIPCATGEEPYSIAAILELIGLDSTTARVHGVDISSKSINHARRGEYGPYSLRAPMYPGTEKLFQRSANRSVVAERYKSICCFERANAFEYLESSQHSFSVIFCRNLLIYFNTEQQLRLLRLLTQRLELQGLLILSPAEAPLVSLGSGLPLKRLSACCFECCEQTVATPTAELKNENTFVAQSLLRNSPRIAYPAPTFKSTLPASFSEQKRNSEQITPTTPYDLFNHSSYELALHACTEIIETGEADQGICLLAAYSALRLNQPTIAEGALKKVLYLNPHHEEALLQLALLAFERGDYDESQKLRSRALRSHERNEGRE